MYWRKLKRGIMKKSHRKISKNLLPLEITQLFSMAKGYFQEVATKYDFYQSLVDGRKTTEYETVSLTKVGNNNKILETAVEVSHESSDVDEMALIVEVNKANQGNYKFKLRYHGLIPAPFFRFDSVGETHWNKVDGIKLNEQQVTTPHFHRFNKDGIEIAYKTEKLKDEETAKALQDIDLCLAHFCHESNLRLNEDDFPKVAIMPDTLGMQVFNDDPNQNIDF